MITSAAQRLRNVATAAAGSAVNLLSNNAVGLRLMGDNQLSINFKQAVTAGQLENVKFYLNNAAARISDADKVHALASAAGAGHEAVISFLRESCKYLEINVWDAIRAANANKHYAIVDELIPHLGRKYNGDISLLLYERALELTVQNPIDIVALTNFLNSNMALISTYLHIERLLKLATDQNLPSIAALLNRKIEVLRDRVDSSSESSSESDYFEEDVLEPTSAAITPAADNSARSNTRLASQVVPTNLTQNPGDDDDNDYDTNNDGLVSGAAHHETKRAKNT